MGEKRLITAALPYINGTPHLGHIVGSHLPADIFARFCRLKGYETLFVGGTDENGSTSEIAAAKIGVPIGDFSDRIHSEHKRIYGWFQISYDIFSRTSSALHHETVREFFQAIEKNGYIEEGKLPVFFSKTDNQFLPDRYVKGTCPKCGFEEASGDQCEKCSFVLEPSQLKNPKSTVSGSAVELVEATHLFFRLDKLSGKLAAWLGKKTGWEKQVTALANGWIADGLKSRCITRDLKHGVKVPVKGFEDKVFYVWFEAPIGYLSFTKEATPDWRLYWQNNECGIYNFLGKDNIPFHTIFWPGMIIANGVYSLPDRVIGLQYLTFEQEKFSKSKNKGVFCDNLPSSGIASDVWRYYLTCLIPENQDTEFKWAEFQERVNSDLIANYGNLVNRTFSFIHSKLGGVVTKPKKWVPVFERAILEKEIVIASHLENCEFRDALKEFFSLSSIGNKYFSDSAPWKKSKEEANEILFNCVSLIRCLAVLSEPFFPTTTEKVFSAFGKKKAEGWLTIFDYGFADRYEIGKPEVLFKKILPEDLEKAKAIVSVSTDLKELFRVKEYD